MDRSCSICFYHYRDEDLLPCRECWHTEFLEGWKSGEKKCNHRHKLTISKNC